MSRFARASLPLLLLLAGVGCEVEPYCLNCEEAGVDGGMDGGTDAGVRRDGGSADAMTPDAGNPDGCTPGATELCNAADDDCDGMVDEGIDTATDLENCGGCGMRCAPAHAFGECVAGACEVLSCDVGYFDRDGDPDNGCEDHCVASEPEETLCDRRDNDCDGNVDETFDLMADPDNCGVCGRVCRFAHTSATCDAGVCSLGACDPGFYDIDGLLVTGCEYACTPTGAETCNLRDDDCNGMVDEGDPEGGAACGISVGACVQGTMHCTSSGLTCMGGVGPVAELCNGIDDNCNGGVDEGNPEGGRVCGVSMGVCVAGREQCSGGALVCMGASTPGTEICNGLDDNCDGVVDDGNPGGGASCGTNTGACVAGTVQCMSGGLSCVGEVGPTLETCNMIDDDCDGTIDNGFLFATDPRNCGMCGNVCSFANAVAMCSTGTCAMGPCLPGFVDRDGLASNGCEYACDFAGAEVCNGRDDDCNGVIDDGLTPPSTFCNPNGVCASTTPTCGATGWTCTYPATYETTETRCDGLDNDCDGAIDEPFPTVGLSCDNGAVGTCLRTGVYQCAPDQTSPPVCNAAAPPAPGVESCNGLDDDCDGVIDNSAPASWVPFALSGGGGGNNRWIFQYEASRTDSNSSAEGSRSATSTCSSTGGSGGTCARVCSEPNRQPWINASRAEAEAACNTIGARLCTEAEWQRACETSSGTACTWSYSSSCTNYAALTCNGFDNDVSGAPGIQNGILATGSMSSCYASWGGGASQHIFDMSGNVQEWTSPRAAGVNPMRGGSYNDLSGGTTCQFNFEVAGDTFRAPNVGFRCCRSTAP